MYDMFLPPYTCSASLYIGAFSSITSDDFVQKLLLDNMSNHMLPVATVTVQWHCATTLLYVALQSLVLPITIISSETKVMDKQFEAQNTMQATLSMQLHGMLFT
jgi:hypothetical protein